MWIMITWMIKRELKKELERRRYNVTSTDSDNLKVKKSTVKVTSNKTRDEFKNQESWPIHKKSRLLEMAKGLMTLIFGIGHL